MGQQIEKILYAAINSLIAAAEELGVDVNQLADRAKEALKNDEDSEPGRDLTAGAAIDIAVSLARQSKRKLPH
ncbi:hypothetical protein [Pseudomonas fluorescens]|uniref:Uncharacterized protein n=1 Tax=Pseudomonas fluorescens TaxID=294 RepID=A0A944DMB4_PSEFL|nr:hypothetical protein [Pseudomonas fluorescens]MBT2295722.1 hypothetical protein [Pseudomonas fluorescens]MBT2305979.1 hypothetical protein [Pseudomonas fluorescens]MBT2314664.1 hypothetical protein [Pseudomonas fluorescens]MBT2315587.1 hypothetical protein [Pseudomonas fluorescens]MBT2331424.1 hypothetical protein [Pseudomonas fluorescens]